MEMMAVIAIIGVILAIALPAYSSWRERTAVRSAADALMAHLKQARHLAIAENRSVTIDFTPPPPPKRPVYWFDKGRGQPYRNKRIVLPRGVTLATRLTGGKLTFTSRGTAANACVTLASATHARWVEVNGIGRAYFAPKKPKGCP